MRLRSTLAILILVSLTCIGCDQVTKTAAEISLQGREPVMILHGLLQLAYVENAGAFMSIGAGLSVALRFWIFVLLPALAVVFLLFVSFRAKTLRLSQVLALGLLIGGGCGNLIDRVHWGFVRDFIQLDAGYLRTGVFNVADAAITSAVLLFAITSRRPRRGGGI